MSIVDLVRLQEAPDPVDRLQPVVELEADAGEDRAVAVILEVAAGAEHRRLGGQPDLAAGEGVGQRLVRLQVLRPVDRGGARARAQIAFRSSSRSCQSRK
jgi:hypothetical protein